MIKFETLCVNTIGSVDLQDAIGLMKAWLGSYDLECIVDYWEIHFNDISQYDSANRHLAQIKSIVQSAKELRRVIDDTLVN